MVSRILYISNRLRCSPFRLSVYLHDYREYMDKEQFGAMTWNGHARMVYDLSSGVEGHTALGAWVRRWSNCRRRDVVTRSYFTHYVDMSCEPCKEEHEYVRKLSTIVSQCYLRSSDQLPSIELSYVSWAQLYEQVYLFYNLRHWIKGITVER